MKGVIKQFVIFLKPTIWKLAIFLFLPLVLFIFKGSDGLFFLPAIVGTFLLGNLCLPLAGHQCSIVWVICGIGVFYIILYLFSCVIADGFEK